MKTSVGWFKKSIMGMMIVGMSFVSLTSIADVSGLGEFQVNASTMKTVPSIPVGNVTVTELKDGGFVVVWAQTVDGLSWGLNAPADGINLYAQRYDANGFTVGAAFLVNTTLPGVQLKPSAAALGDGGFVVTWSGQLGIYGQRYKADGSPNQGEFIVATPNSPTYSASSVTASDELGGFIVKWNVYWGGTTGSAIFTRKYAADGTVSNPIAASPNVNESTIGIQRANTISKLKDGRFVTVWYASLDGTSSGPHSVYMRFLNSDGEPIGNAIVVQRVGVAAVPSVAVLEDGSIIVAATSAESTTVTVPGVHVYHFTADGAAIGDPVAVALPTYDVITNTWNNRTVWPSVRALKNGGFVVVYDILAGDINSIRKIILKEFDKNAVEQSTTEAAVSSNKRPISADAAVLNNGDVVGAWYSTEQIGSDLYVDIIAERFTGFGVVVTTPTPLVTPVPTATPIPPTSTPAPTITPIPTATPTPINVKVSGLLKIDANLRNVKYGVVTMVGSAGANCTTTLSKSTYSYSCTLTSGSGQVTIGNYSLGTVTSQNNKVCAPVTASVGVESGSGVSEATTYVFSGMSANQTVNFIIKKQQASCGAGYR